MYVECPLGKFRIIFFCLSVRVSPLVVFDPISHIELKLFTLHEHTLYDLSHMSSATIFIGLL